ncbi:MAG: UbiD family decarboxylase [Chloroflexota bacterium]
MTYYRDFREHLQALEQQGKLRRIKREINKDTQLHPLVRLQFRGLPEEERTAFLFEKVTDSRGRKYRSSVAVAALAASAQVYAIGMKCRPEEISERMAQAELHPIAPQLVSQAPVHEEVHLGDSLLQHGGLEEFPIPVTTPGFDAAPYITAPSWVTKDPDTGVPNIGMYRAMVKSPGRTAVMFMSTSQGAFIHWDKCRQRGRPLEAAIVIGATPNISYVAVSKLPIGLNEYSVAGGIAGEPVPVVKCKTVDLEVPATAEIVIEGELSTAEVEPEAPFGEALGFVGSVSMMPCFTVKCITHRKNPIWLATISQYPPSESSKIRQYPNEGTVYKHLRYDLGMSHVLAVAFYDDLGSSRLMAIKVKKTDPAQVWRTLEAAAQRFTLSKIIVAVDEDVNLRDLDSVMLAICMRTQPHRDYRIIKVTPSTIMDHSLAPEEMPDISQFGKPAAPREKPLEASVILMDATMKWQFPPISLPRKGFMEEAQRIWQEEGLPPLKLKEPWWGIDLGLWDQEKEELAEAAAKGDYYRAGELYTRRRKRIDG